MLNFKAKLGWDNFVNSSQSKTKTKVILSVTFSIIIAMLIPLFIAIAAGCDPKELFTGLFVNAVHEPKILITNICIFIIAGLSFIFAYKVGLFNIGITGQMMGAGITCLFVALVLNKYAANFPIGLSQILMILIAIVVAMLVGTLITILKVYCKVNEVISSILLNWIIFFIVRIIIVDVLYKNPESIPLASPEFPEIFRLSISGTKSVASGGWIPVLVITIILITTVAVLLRYTVFGKKVISVGTSFSASKYLGISTKKILFSSMAISSAIAGILGYVLYASKASPVIPVGYTADVLPAEGLNGVTVGLISLCNPIATIPVSFVLGWVQTSSSLYVTVPSTLVDLVNGFVILGAAMFMIILNFKPWIWLNQWLRCKNYAKNAQKFTNDFDRLYSKYVSMLNTIKGYSKILKNYDKVFELESKLLSAQDKLLQYDNVNIIKLGKEIEKIKKENVELTARLKVPFANVNQLKQQLISNVSLIDEMQKQIATAQQSRKVSKLIKKVRLIERRIADQNKYIDSINSEIAKFDLKMRSNEIKLMIEEEMPALINLIKSKYIIELSEIKAQFKKHILIDKTSQTFWIEFEQEKEKNETIDSIDKLKIKALKKVEDKIYKLNVQDVKRIEQKIEIYNTNKILLTQKYVDSKEILDKHLDNIDKKIKHQQELLSKLKIDNKPEIIELEQELININNKYESIKSKYLTDFEQHINKKKFSQAKLKRVFNKAIDKANKIEINQVQKELLVKWINDSYEHALSHNGGNK